MTEERMKEIIGTYYIYQKAENGLSHILLNSFPGLPLLRPHEIWDYFRKLEEWYTEFNKRD